MSGMMKKQNTEQKAEQSISNLNPKMENQNDHKEQAQSLNLWNPMEELAKMSADEIYQLDYEATSNYIYLIKKSKIPEDHKLLGQSIKWLKRRHQGLQQLEQLKKKTGQNDRLEAKRAQESWCYKLTTTDVIVSQIITGISNNLVLLLIDSINYSLPHKQFPDHWYYQKVANLAVAGFTIFVLFIIGHVVRNGFPCPFRKHNGAIKPQLRQFDESANSNRSNKKKKKKRTRSEEIKMKKPEISLSDQFEF